MTLDLRNGTKILWMDAKTRSGVSLMTGTKFTLQRLTVIEVIRVLKPHSQIGRQIDSLMVQESNVRSGFYLVRR